MKPFPYTAPLATLLAVTSFASASPETGSGHGIRFLPTDLKAPIAAAQSDESLKKRQQIEKFGGFAPQGSATKGWDLMENSEFLAFNGRSTLVPKGAIIHVPEKLRQHVVAKPVGDLIAWNEFAGLHRGLVTFLPITLEEASGQIPVSPTRLEAANKPGLIVVASLNGNPISFTPKTTDPATADR